jgi:hypothetical protein
MNEVLKKAIKLIEVGIRTLVEKGTFKMSPQILY